MITPFITIIIPCRNEEFFIAKCLDSIVLNNYPKEKIEIFVIDGISSDNTIGILQNYIVRFPFIELINNPDRIFPAAVNIGVKRSRGEFIFIIGAHATYNNDYFSRCVEYSLKHSADNVGGVLKTVPVSPDLAGLLISTVLSNPFGVGDSKFRTGSDGILEVDTVFGGCYKKEVFHKYGMFNENLISTSDYEFNKRIKKKGAKILLIPDIIVTYFTRSTIKKFIINNLRNGFWATYPIAFTKNIPVSLRHLIPLSFLVAIIFLITISLKWSFFINFLYVLLLIYLSFSLYFSIKAIGTRYYLIPFLPVFFIILHLTYGAGSLWGGIKVILFKMKNILRNS